jgi:hypothetical protein
MSADILLASDGGYWIMSGLTPAGWAFVEAHSSGKSVRSPAVSVGAAAYPQILEAAKAAGLTVVQQ